MRKPVILAVVFIIIILLGVGGYFVWKGMQSEPIEVEPSGEIEVQPLGLAEQANVVSVYIKENASGVNRKVDVTYPNIQSFANKSIQKNINDSITEVIFAYRDEVNAIVDDETDKANLYAYTSSYEKYTYEDYLSLVISNNYETGGIRSNQWKDTYNIDVRTERLMTLEDVFAPNVNWQEEIVKEVNKQAEAMHYELMNGEGLQEIESSQKFYIKDAKLVIYFDPAAIAPASYGELQFEMPFTMGEDLRFHA